jgi:ribose 5-phosphate isomerase A
MELAERLARLGEASAALVADGDTVGLGTGSTANAMIVALGQRVATGLKIRGVVTSSATEALAASVGIPTVSFDEIDSIDIGIDGADEIDPQLQLIKGRGGALLYEKLVAERCRRYVIIATNEKLVAQLGLRLPLPIEVIPYGWKHTAAQIAALGLKPMLRTTSENAPLITDGGHYLLDCIPQLIPNAPTLAAALKSLTGVVDHGLFCTQATDAMTIDESGAIQAISRD